MVAFNVKKKINVKFDSTAENLYNQSLKLCLDLFTKNYKKILYGKLKPKNKLVTGSYYHSKNRKFKKIKFK